MKVDEFCGGLVGGPPFYLALPFPLRVLCFHTASHFLFGSVAGLYPRRNETSHSGVPSYT